MADFTFNIAKGRVVQFYDNVDSNDPAASGFVAVAIVTTAADGLLKDYETLAALLGDADTDEATNSGYSRVTLTDADLGAWAPDHTNNRVDLDIPDLDFGDPAAGDNWTDVVLCYAPDTAGADSTLIPMACYDFVVEPDGTNITAGINVAGFYRAQ